MSEKIRLANGQIFALRPLGVAKNDIARTRSFIFTSDLPIGDVQALFMDIGNITSIDHLLSNDVIRGNYSDCAAYKSISQDDAEIYTVELSTDILARQVQELAAKVAQLEAAQQPVPPEEPVEENPPEDEEETPEDGTEESEA